MIKEDAVVSRNQRDVIDNTASSNAYKLDFYHIPVTNENVLSYIREHRGCTVSQIQDGFCYHRGNRKFLKFRRQIHAAVLRLEVAGYIKREGVKNFSVYLEDWI